MAKKRKWHPRIMIPRDLPEMKVIEKQSVIDQTNPKNGGLITPWSQKKFLRYMVKPWDECICMVVDRDEEVVGFIIIRKLQILNLAVRKDMRHQGIGSSLIRWAQEVPDFTQDKLCIYVRETNEAGINFLTAEEGAARGFHIAKRVPGFYKDPANHQKSVEAALLLKSNSFMESLIRQHLQ